jgi:hypothetical protein
MPGVLFSRVIPAYCVRVLLTSSVQSRLKIRDAIIKQEYYLSQLIYESSNHYLKDMAEM